MRKLSMLAAAIAAGAILAGCSEEPSTLAAATQHLRAGEVVAIEFTGSGSTAELGQAFGAGMPWLAFDISNYSMTINYEGPSAHTHFTRTEPMEGDNAPEPTAFRKGYYGFRGPTADQYVSGTHAWNISSTGSVGPQPGTVAERTAEIWATPHGFLKAALANSPEVQRSESSSDVFFTINGNHRFRGTINARNEVERVQTWIDNPVQGDMLVETTFTDYRDYNGIQFPSRIVRTAGGHPVLTLDVADVKIKASSEMVVPDQVRNYAAPPIRVEEEKLADGVYHLRGGSHHSLAIEQSDHIVVVEAPLNEKRSLAVIEKVKNIIPDKPIRYVITTHVHFDHSGGLRTYVAEGATIVTHQNNQAFFEDAWSAPRLINPDALAQSNKGPMFEPVQEKHVLNDAARPIEIHEMMDDTHSEGFLVAYLPAQKIFFESDSFSPGTPGATLPEDRRPWAVSLLENIERLGLDIDHIAGGHGSRVGTMADLRAAIGPTAE